MKFREHLLRVLWWEQKFAYCKGLLRAKQMRSCLFLNGNKTYNKRETKVLSNNFDHVDIVQECSLLDYIPSKTYDLIVLNWGMRLLGDKDAK